MYSFLLKRVTNELFKGLPFDVSMKHLSRIYLPFQSDTSMFCVVQMIDFILLTVLQLSNLRQIYSTNRNKNQMKRHSIKKASTFKLQAERSRFQAFINDIENCPMSVKFPQLNQLIKESSQAVFSHCYTFRQDSPFSKGLNYGGRSIGFSFQDNILNYKEWLPNVSEAFVMGEFNSFDKTSHRMNPSEEDGLNWFSISIDFSGSHIENDGSKIMLRLIDHQGTEFYMIPPSCHIISKGYGIVKKDEIIPLSKKKLRINELLAYTIDLSKVSLKQCLEMLERDRETLEHFNTIILKNIFKNTYGLLHKYSLEFSEVEKLREIVLAIKNDIGCKAVIEWNLEPSKLHYEGNPVEGKFMNKTKEGNYQFDFSQTEVMAYYLANASYFYQNLAIDGIHFTKLGNVSDLKEGVTALKCLNVLNSRAIDSGITLGSSKVHVPALNGEIIDGGYGFNFTYNYHQSLSLSQHHETLIELVKEINSKSNCLALNFNDYDESHLLNLIFVILQSSKGVFSTGNFNKIEADLKKVLKLRCQDKLFESEVSDVRVLQNDSVVLIKRGVSVMVFNFSEEEQKVDCPHAGKMSLMYAFNCEKPQTEANQVTLQPRSALVFEDEGEIEE